MSQPEDNASAPEQVAFAQLETAVADAIERLSSMSQRVRAAEARSAEMSELVTRFTGNEAEAGDLMSRLKRLEDENADLRGRLDSGRAGVERMIARIRFLENQA